MGIERFRAMPLLGILRGVKADQIVPLVEASVAAGLEAIEITMNTKDAPALIEQMSETAKDRLLVGAGTVLTEQDLSDALAAGASFIVTPVYIKQISDACRDRGVPLFPGALTPKEVYEAWQGGAEMIKLFPAACFGPAYFKELAGPFSEIKLLACGGVTTANIGDYFACGASGAAFGGSIFRQEWINAGEFDKVSSAIRELVLAVNPDFSQDGG